MIGRRIRSRVPAPLNLKQLQQPSFLDEWDLWLALFFSLASRLEKRMVQSVGSSILDKVPSQEIEND